MNSTVNARAEGGESTNVQMGISLSCDNPLSPHAEHRQGRNKTLRGFEIWERLQGFKHSLP